MDDFEDSEAFGLVQGWMYTQKISLSAKVSDILQVAALYRLWVLADRLLMPKLQKAVMEEFRLKKPYDHGAAGVRWIEKNTSADSKLWKFLVDRYAFELEPNEWVELAKAGKLPPRFVCSTQKPYVC